jgi:hypothetical protein
MVFTLSETRHNDAAFQDLFFFNKINFLFKEDLSDSFYRFNWVMFFPEGVFHRALKFCLGY